MCSSAMPLIGLFRKISVFERSRLRYKQSHNEFTFAILHRLPQVAAQFSVRERSVGVLPTQKHTFRAFRHFPEMLVVLREDGNRFIA